MRRGFVWVAVASIGMGLVPACGDGEHQSLSSVDNKCQVPCEDDPSKTCVVTCPPNGAAAGIGQGSGAAGNTGTGASGGSAGAGGATVTAVDVTGSVVQFTSIAFDDVVTYVDPITIVVPGFETAQVETEAIGGSFALTGAASGLQWVLAKELDGVGGAYSTYSIQNLNGIDPIAARVVPVDLLDTIGTQINVVSLSPGAGHVVLEIDDVSGAPIEGAEMILAGAAIGYAVAPGQYSSAAGATGSLGIAVALNVPLPSPSEVSVALTISSTTVSTLIQMAPDTVTYARVAVELSP